MTLEGNCGDDQIIEIPNQGLTNCPNLENCSFSYHHEGCFINDYQGCSIYKFREKINEINKLKAKE